MSAASAPATTMTPLVILTVGTSLLTNAGGEGRAPGGIFSQYRQRCSAILKGGNIEPRQLACQLARTLLDGDGLRRELEYRRERSTLKDALPQELSYLALLPGHLGWQQGQKATVALLASDSREGDLCAKAIKLAIEGRSQEAPWSHYTVLDVNHIPGLAVTSTGRDENKPRQAGKPTCPEHLAVTSTGRDENKQLAATFRDQGLPNLVVAMQQLCTEHAGSQVIVNLTGGFKGAIHYAALAALLLEGLPITMHYLFEDTDQIITLPVYPIGLDFPLWHRESVMLQASCAPTVGPLYREQLDRRMQAVADEKGLWDVKGSMARLLRDRYAAQRKADPLQTFSERVIQQFVKGDSYRTRLLDLMANTGLLIWYGDKVPMAAEHAARHHHHLLEIAQLLLTPIADLKSNDDRPFLNDEERFVLLAAILLHDCGHTVGALPVQASAGDSRLVPLFGSEVRDLHQFLAWHRLTDGPEVHGWDRKGDLSREVAYLSLYHRSGMGWQEIDANRARCPFLDFTAVSPLAAAKEYGLAETIDFPKLVALLRVIDGLDVQRYRVGPGPTSEVMTAMFREEADAARARVAGLLPTAVELKGHLSCPAQCFVDQIAAWLDSGSRPRLDHNYRRSRETLGILVAEGAGSQEQRAAAAAWLELARAYDEFALRHRQQLHFDKHESVAQMALLPDEDFNPASCWCFTATLEPSDSRRELLDDREYADRWTGEMEGKTLRQWLLEDIQRELLEPARQYLSDRSGRRFQLTVRWADGPDTASSV